MAGPDCRPGGSATIDGSATFRKAVIDPVLARRYWPQLTLLAAVLVPLLWGALAPLRYDSRELLFEIPNGAHQRRARGEEMRNLPASLQLTLGVQDVLLLRNRDNVPQVFGAVRVMPGKEFSLPFEQAGDYDFHCSAQAGGQMTVHVVDQPGPGWERLRWRADKLVHEMRYLPLVAPG
jgi:hypothetical protein